MQVERTGLQHLPAREGEQLAGQLRAASAGARRRGHELAHLRRVGQDRQLVEHLQVALDHGEQVVEVVRDAAGELADALQPLRMAQRLVRQRALQPGGEQVGERFDETQLVRPEAARFARVHDQRAEGPAAVGQRGADRAAQAGLEAGRRHGEALLGHIVLDHHRRGAREHQPGERAGRVRLLVAERLARGQAARAGNDELAPARLQPPDARRLGTERLERDLRHARQQLPGVACVGGEPPEAGQLLAVVRAPHRLPHPGIGADVAQRRQDPTRAGALHRAERHLDQHLAAVAAARCQLELRAHRPRPRCARVAGAVAAVAGPHRLGHELVHVEAQQLVGGITEHLRRGRVAGRDAAIRRDHQQRVGVVAEQRLQQRFDADAGGQRQRRRAAGAARTHPGLTAGTRM